MTAHGVSLSSSHQLDGIVASNCLYLGRSKTDIGILSNKVLMFGIDLLSLFLIPHSWMQTSLSTLIVLITQELPGARSGHVNQPAT